MKRVVEKVNGGERLMQRWSPWERAGTRLARTRLTKNKRGAARSEGELAV